MASDLWKIRVFSLCQQMGPVKPESQGRVQQFIGKQNT